MDYLKNIKSIDFTKNIDTIKTTDLTKTLERSLIHIDFGKAWDSARRVLNKFSGDIQGIFETRFLEYFRGIDLNRISERLAGYPQNVQKSAVLWAKYGWVPFLPSSGVRNLALMEYPQSKMEADRIMMKKLDENGITTLFDSLRMKVKNHNNNLNTFDEAVKSYKTGLYSGCALLIFALIDSSFLIGQPYTNKSRRKLANNAVEKLYKPEKCQRIISACTTRLIVKNLFKPADDFMTASENGLNRNYISHGMNNYIPTQKDCLQLFVLLYNVYLLFDSKCFSWS